ELREDHGGIGPARQGERETDALGLHLEPWVGQRHAIGAPRPSAARAEPAEVLGAEIPAGAGGLLPRARRALRPAPRRAHHRPRRADLEALGARAIDLDRLAHEEAARLLLAHQIALDRSVERPLPHPLGAELVEERGLQGRDEELLLEAVARGFAALDDPSP